MTTDDGGRLTVDELAALVGDPVERIEELASRGVLDPRRVGPVALARVARTTE